MTPGAVPPCRYEPLPLGRAAFAAGLDPEAALLIHRDLERARRGFIMAGDLHISFLVVPSDEDVLSSAKKADSSPWQKMQNRFNSLGVRAPAPCNQTCPAWPDAAWQGSDSVEQEAVPYDTDCETSNLSNGPFFVRYSMPPVLACCETLFSACRACMGR